MRPTEYIFAIFPGVLKQVGDVGVALAYVLAVFLRYI